MKVCRFADSNGRPTDYKSVALPAELKRQRLPFTITIPQRFSPLCMLFRPSVRRATNNADRGHVFASMRPSTARLWRDRHRPGARSEEHTSELQSLMRIPYAVFCLKKTIKHN